MAVCRHLQNAPPCYTVYRNPVSWDSFLGFCAWLLYPHRVHFWDLPLPSPLFCCFGFLRPSGCPFLSAGAFTSTLGSSPAITCILSLVASNMRPISTAVFKVRFLLFSRQRCLTRSSRYLQAIALRINLSVLVISRPLAKSLRSVTKLSNDSPGCCRRQSNLTAFIIGFFLAPR